MSSNGLISALNHFRLLEILLTQCICAQIHSADRSQNRSVWTSFRRSVLSDARWEEYGGGLPESISYLQGGKSFSNSVQTTVPFPPV